MAAPIPAGIFLVTLVLLLLRRIGHVPLHRGPVAFFGGLLMIMAGALTPAEAVAAVDLPVLFLLAGILFLGAALAEAGFFQVAAGIVAGKARNERDLVLWSLVVSAVLSAFFLNEAVALFLPPVLFLVLRWAGVPAFRTLAAVVIGLHLGALWGPGGNAANAYLANAYGLGAQDFALHHTPVVLFGLAVAAPLLARGASTAPFPPRPDFTSVDRRLPLVLGSIAVGLTVALFLAAPAMGMPLWVVAVTNGTMVLAMVPLIAPAGATAKVLSKVDGNLLMLAAGMFLLVAGAENAGLMELVTAGYPLAASTRLGEFVNIALAGLVATNVVSAIPTVLLADPQIAMLGERLHAQMLAVAIGLGGMTTGMASAATLIVAEQASKQDEPFPFWRFTVLGVVVSGLTLGFAVAYFAFWL